MARSWLTCLPWQPCSQLTSLVQSLFCLQLEQTSLFFPISYFAPPLLMSPWFWSWNNRIQPPPAATHIRSCSIYLVVNQLFWHFNFCHLIKQTTNKSNIYTYYFAPPLLMSPWFWSWNNRIQPPPAATHIRSCSIYLVVNRLLRRFNLTKFLPHDIPNWGEILL